MIGEGEKDEAPMLYNGEKVGNGRFPPTDVAVDPIDGTTLTSLGRGNALSVIAAADRGAMFDPGPCVYMEKIATGPAAARFIDIGNPPSENLAQVAEAKGKPVSDITAVILDRDRHDDLIQEVRESGARIRLIPDGDLLKGVRYEGRYCRTQSLVMRSLCGRVSHLAAQGLGHGPAHGPHRRAVQLADTSRQRGASHGVQAVTVHH